ncbi:pectinesterase inhibitor 12-like [Triticum dicoccoides]|uniref:pectinesterase inhibitor 12-like n=1 Tax=Triticum dicoccoides TaxID=85692 RepID=UPI00188FE24C|nr:pectinesterase inhibitor 12-like [Triticum dicoccoides]
MANTTRSIAIVLIVLAALSFGFPAIDADATLLVKTCKKTTNALLCLAVLNVDPKSAYATTEHDLASAALQVAINTADHNVEVIHNLAKDVQGTPEGGALNICLGAYVDAANDLEIDARPGFDGGNYVGARNLVLGAKGAGGRCEDAFKGVNKKSPVTNIDQQMTEHCGVAGELIGLLIHK